MRKPYTCLLTAALLFGGAAGCADGDRTPAPPPAQASTPAVSASLTSAPLTSAPATSAPASAPAPPPAKTTSRPATDKAFPLTVSRRGGLAGVDDSVRISADGSAIVTRRGRPPVTTTVPATKMAELRGLLDRLGPAAGRPARSGRPGAVCNDGFEYQITGPSIAARVDGCGTPENTELTRLLTVAAALFNS
ncbi:hypothetical protein ACFY36_11105 [Actinoplanes sp. NPDC000266]